MIPSKAKCKYAQFSMPQPVTHSWSSRVRDMREARPPQVILCVWGGMVLVSDVRGV